MPVAVDRTPDMGASRDIGNIGDPLQQTPAQAERTKKARLYRTPKKLREVVEEQPVAGSSTERAREDGSTWAWRSLTESSASKVKPVFTKDGSYFMTASGANVKIYSVATGQVVSTLSTANTASRPAVKTGYGEAISSMILSPHNPFQLFTASLDGCVRIWDFVDAVLLQTMDLGLPVLHVAAHEKFKNEVYVALSKKTKKLNVHKNPTKEDNAVVMRISLTPTHATARLPVQHSAETRHIGKARAPVGLAFSPSGSWLVAIGAHKAYVARMTDLQSGFTKLISPDKLTCMAFHPTEEYFATGDARGLVRLWYCLNDSIPSGVSGVEKKAPTTTLHWHAHPVASIAFTANGAYLLSGGEEAVLVIWQLHTGKKEFIPRVGAPISTVTLSTSTSSNEEEYLLGLSDASFVFVRSGTLRLGKTIARVKLDPAISHDRPSSSTRVPLAAHAISSTLVLPSSHPSTLQLYAPTTSKLLSELEVSPSNRISRRDEKALEPCRVEISAMADSGEWMATLDTREGEESFRGEAYLKLWAWDRKASQWVLNTRIDRPHGLSKVTAITFRPRSRDDASLLLATTGEDGVIKMWGVRRSTTKTGETESYWVARSTVRYRSEVPTHASWAQDGSLLAVSLGPYVVLYDPSTMLVVRTLTCPEVSVILSAHFIGRSGRYIALRGQRDLVLWDLVLDSVNWHYRSYSFLSHIFSHPREDAFVAFESDPKSSRPKTHIVKFTPSSSIPTSSHTLPFRLQSVSSCPPRWLMSNEPSSFAFVGITHDWNAVIFGDQIRLADADQSEGKVLVGSGPVTKHTLFQDIFGKSAFADLSNRHAPPPVASSGSASWKGKQVEEVFKTPAYLMPPLSTLFDPLMDEFLKPRVPGEEGAAVDEGGEKEEDGEGDVSMEIEGEGAEAPIVVGNRLERIVDDKEMVAMIKVFKNHCLQPASAPSAPAPASATPKLNGYHKHTTSKSGATVNGAPPQAPPPKVNGIVNVNTTSINTTSKAVLPETQSPPSPPPERTSSPVKVGQKRKKSLG